MITAFALVALAAFVVWRAERVVAPLVAQHLALRERQVALDERVKAAPTHSEPIPADLAHLAEQYREEWARDQVLDALRDDYTRAGNWDDVRNAHFGVQRS